MLIIRYVKHRLGSNLKGALVFLGAFLVFLVISLGYPGLPPGRQIYDSAIGVESDYSISGTPVTLLAIGIFNGVIWGIIIYIVFWVLTSYVFKKEPTATVKVKTT
jgi:hypothetical protein